MKKQTLKRGVSMALASAMVFSLTACGNGGGGGSPAGLCGISYEPDSGVSTSIEPGTPGPGGQGSPGGQGGDGIIILYFNVPVVKPSGPLVTKTPKWFNDKFGRRFIV